MSSRVPSMRLGRQTRHAPARATGWPDPGVMALALLMFILMVCATVASLILTGAS